MTTKTSSNRKILPSFFPGATDKMLRVLKKKNLNTMFLPITKIFKIIWLHRHTLDPLSYTGTNSFPLCEFQGINYVWVVVPFMKFGITLYPALGIQN